jgi:hypothetical protein
VTEGALVAIECEELDGDGLEFASGDLAISVTNDD